MKAGAVVACAAFIVAATLADATGASSARQEKEARAVMYKYARCVIKRRHDMASRALLSDADNDDIMKLYPALIDGDCLGEVAGGVQMTFTGDLYRYALADALVEKDFGREGPVDFTNKLPLAHLLAPTSAQRADRLRNVKGKKQAKVKADLQKDDEVVLLSRYGECIARADPVGSRLWVLTPPDVAEEISRIKVLQPAFEACLGNGTVRFSRATLRGLIALNYYRLAMATPQPYVVH